MRLFKTLLFVSILLATADRVSAQFHISTVTPKEADTKQMDDTIKPIAPINNLFFSEARYKAERRAIRKERNTVLLTGSAIFDVSGFDNWAAGGQNVFATSLKLYFSHTYTKHKFNFGTVFDARYGISRIEKENFKNEDNFVLNLTSSWELSKNWSYAATFQYRSQFSNGYKSRTDTTLVSAFMAPGTIAPAIGFIYRNKKVPLTVSIMPVAGSVTFVLNDSLSQRGAYGVKPGEKQTGAIGASLQIDFDKSFAKDRLTYRTYLYGFCNYNGYKNAYVNWKNTLAVKVFKFITADFFCSALFDKTAKTPYADEGRWLQLNYKLGIGLTYTFKNK